MTNGISPALFLLLLVSAAHSIAQPLSIDVGGEKQLFIDSMFVEQPDKVSLALHPARKTGEKVFVPDKAWENASLSWFSVLEDAGKYRMWYECYDVEGWPTTNDTSFCYAESTDGIHWTKPSLGLVDYQGSKENNILFRQLGPAGAYSRVHGSGVFIDPHADAASRYKCVSQGTFEGRGTPPQRVAGMVSPDGLHWTRFPVPICDVFADSQYSGFWDNEQNAYVLYGRVAGRGRSIGRAQSGDFKTFEPLSRVLENVDTDDLYNPAALKYPHAARTYLMFSSYYHHSTDQLDIYLAVSRDGIQWTWPDPSMPFIRLGNPGDFDAGSLYMGQGLLSVKDELWQFYSGSPLKHEEAVLEKLTQPESVRVYSRVISRLDGYVSIDAGKAPGSFVTPAIRFTGSALALNVQTRDGGSVRVGLLDAEGNALPGFRIDDCAAITGDHIQTVVKWNTSENLAAKAGNPIRIRFEMTDASLFAFQFISNTGKE